MNNKHGMRRTRPYRIWCHMKGRCNNPKSTGYKYWGGRGIKVCREWNDFNKFWTDMEKTYFDGAEIDRIDNNGNYTEQNCRWVTRSTQASNKTNNRLISWRGKTKNLTEWCRHLDIDYKKTWNRIVRYKWKINKAFSI